VDNRNGRLRGDLSELVRRICHRGLGAGADGVILVEQPGAFADLKMAYFNRDGGRADLCGNGVRCVARWAAGTGSFPSRLRIETGAGVLVADGAAEPPWFTLPLGRVAPERVALPVGGRTIEAARVRAGVPHLVVEVADPFASGTLDDAPALRAHPALGPEGANVDYYAARGEHLVDVRFYERGVEAETLSSGSGSIAVALAASSAGRAASPVTCRNREGLTATVALAEGPGGIEATLAGEVRTLYSGRLGPGILS
jgi:diaminopimelate epimerase